MLSTDRPRPGPHEPLAGTPPRNRGSARRTTSIDVLRPGGLGGDTIVADLRGQDSFSSSDGTLHVHRRLAAMVTIDAPSGTVTGLDGSVARDLIEQLTGVGVRRGFGRLLLELMPDGALQRGILFSVLEDLPGALLVSGYAPLREGLLGGNRKHGEERARAQEDICSGWVKGGPVVEGLRTTGSPAVPMGPLVPSPGPWEDRDAWHEMDVVTTNLVRRRRRLDVVPVPGVGRGVSVQAHFRDSYGARDGEMVMHEYLVNAATDDYAEHVTRVDVEARVLPWAECPGAVASAGRVVGMAVEDIPQRVRTEFSGPTTCTHLNSTLRSLADLSALTSLVPSRP